MSISAAESAPRDGTSRVAVAITCLLILAALIDSQVVAAIAPQIAAGLGSLPTIVASSVTIYAVTAAAVALLLGRYSRRMDARAWLPAAAAVFVAASLLASASTHVSVFLAARSLAGVAGGLISALAIAALADASAYAKRGKQMSGVAISYFLAPVVGVPLGAFLTERTGWRSVFWTVAILAALAGLLIKLFPLTPAASDDGAREGTNNAEASVAPTTPAKTSLWELMNRSRSTRMGLISAFFVSGGLVGFTTFLGTWLAEGFHVRAGGVGRVYALAGVGAVAGSVLGGMLADRLGKRRIAAQSSALMVFCLLLLPTFTWSATLWALICITAFLAAMRVAPLQAIVTEVVEPAERATYVALRNSASQLGIAAAVAGGGRLYAGYGLTGVGLLCTALTLGAWLTIRLMDDPHDRIQATSDVELRPHIRGTGRRWSRRLAITALCLVLFVCAVLPYALSFLITKAGTRPGERDRKDTPAAQNTTFENVTFVSSDGNKLSGWYLPSSSHKVTIIMAHGLFRSRYEMLDRGVALWREGYGVLLYDLRRHGQSRAEFSTLGYDERHDVTAALMFMRERAPENRIVLMGVSMGAAATLLSAAESDSLMAVVAESSFLSFSDTVYHHIGMARLPKLGIRLPTFPFASLLVRFTAWRLNFRAADFDVLQAVKKIKCPILFIGGSADRRMPNESVLEPLYAAANHPLKRKFIVEGAQHGHAYDRDDQSRVEYIKAFTDFLQTIETQAVE
ncbi:MAG TPA: MFS transporter [Pyrinomonadaceae bacterium]|jgi:predicted MFS family arabinose efflux permease/pimeloyl-ACP methyl ester carboxylesterase